MSLKRFTRVELQAINRVYISLKLIFISDLVDSVLMIVNKNFQLGFINSSCISYNNWPISKPSANDRTIWMKFIEMIIDIRGIILHSIGL